MVDDALPDTLPVKDYDSVIVEPIGNGVVLPATKAQMVVVGTMGEIARYISTSARTSGNVKQRFRQRVFAGKGGIKEGTARLSLNAFYCPLATTTEDNVSGYTASGHLEVGGVPYPFTWGGQSTGAVASGAAEVLSDALAAMPEVPEGTEMWLLLVREYQVGAFPSYLVGTAVSPQLAGKPLSRRRQA